MPLDIKPLHHDGLNCLQSLVITFANWIGRSYEPTFAGAWGFDFKKDEPGFFGDRISFPELDTFGAVKKYCNIELISHFNHTPDELLEIIQIELEKGMPVIIETDLFYCCWSRDDFQKNHVTHACMAIGLSEGSLVCIDCVPASHGDLLPLEDFRKSASNCATFSIGENIDTDIDFRSIIANTLNRMTHTESGGSVFEAIREFSTELNNSFELVADEIRQNGVFVATHLFRKLTFIAGSRILFAEFLKYCAKKYSIPFFLPICEEFTYVASNWTLVRALILRASYISMDNAPKEKIIQLLNEIADHEEKIHKKLLQWYQQNGSEYTIPMENPSFVDVSTEQESLWPLDLTPYLNNNGFSKVGLANSTANLSGSGFFLLAENLPDNGWLEVCKTKFRFPVIETGKNDNISCKQQIISVPKQVYSGIMLLGCAEWGNFSDYIEFVPCDGDSMKIQIHFTDCVYDPFYGEKEAWAGHMAQINAHNKVQIITTARLFATKYSLGDKKEFDRIILPYCPNIHIFAISLYD